MKLRPTFLILLAFSPLAVQAADEMDLARSRNCLTCHAMDKRLVGPSFKDISERYASRPGSEARLAEKIVKGGSGVWGPVPMPSNPQVNPEEAARFASWLSKPMP